MTPEERKEIAEIAKSAAHYVLHETLMTAANKIIEKYERNSKEYAVVHELLNALVVEAAFKNNIQLMGDLFDVTGGQKITLEDALKGNQPGE
jgi:hypothetical protein